MASEAVALAAMSDVASRVERWVDAELGWAIANPALYRGIGMAFRSPELQEPLRSATSLRQVGIGAFIDDVGLLMAERGDPAAAEPGEDEVRAAVIWAQRHGYITSVLYLPSAERGDEQQWRRTFLDLQLASLGRDTGSVPVDEPTPRADRVDVPLEPRHGTHVELRDRLLDTARDIVLAEQDLGALTIRRLASEVGVASGSVYRHFPDRDAILVEVAERDRHRWQVRAEAELAQIADPTERLLGRLRLDLAWGVEHPLQFKILWLGDRPASSNRFAHGVSETNDGWRPYLADVVALVQACGATVDPRALAQAVWSDVHGFLSLTLVAPGFPWPSSTRLHRTFLAMARRGLLGVLAPQEGPPSRVGE